MARNKEPEKGPSKAYLLSFGDTMTTLLAFFIILCSLAEDQTGANLHTGTGSFVKAVNGMGLPGVHSGKKSARTFQMQETSPLYMAEKPEKEEAEKDGTGPDEDNSLRSVSRETEEFKRFLNEMERKGKVGPQPVTTGEVTFDFFEPIKEKSPYLPDAYAAITAQMLPLLRRESHQVEIVVWATTPSSSAWLRAASQANGIKQDLVKTARLSLEHRGRLATVARPWMDPDAKRPILSVIMRRVTQAPSHSQ